MALSKSHRIIWLDAFIGKDGECEAFKRQFTAPIEPLARVGDPIDRLIQALEVNAVPFIFIHQIDEAMEAIRETEDFQVIFISSGSLGRHIIPRIHPQHGHVYSFYIFCGLMANYTDLIIDYLDVIQIFDHEKDLLVRLIRDLSLEMINGGITLLDANRPVEAKDVFERARKLEQAANDEDRLHPPFLERLQQLGDESHPGLIQRAEEMNTALYGPQTTTAQPVLVRETEGEPQGNTTVNEQYANAVQATGDAQTNIDEQQDSPLGEETS